jgi:ATP-binding cassette subfamily C protein CydC
VVFERLTDLRVGLYRKLVGHSISLSHVVNSGASVKTLVDDVERAQEYQLRIKLPGSSAILSLLAGTLLGWWVRPESLLIMVPASLLLLFVFPQLISRFTVLLAENIEAEENTYTQIIESSVHGVIEAQIYGYLDQSLVPAAQQELKIVKSEKMLLNKSGVFALSTYLIIASAIVGSVWIKCRINHGQYHSRQCDHSYHIHQQHHRCRWSECYRHSRRHRRHTS